MGSCCEPSGCHDIFGARFSRHLARRYRKRGLDRTAGRIVAFLAGQGIEGATVLEIGGGVGAIQLELLRRGAARATNLELVDSYDADAASLAAEAGLADRVARHLLDLVDRPESVEPHDIVVLHRVVCCYPDYQSLLTAAADHAKAVLVFSYPPRSLITRMMCLGENLLFRARGLAFRTYVHDPVAMTSVAQHGQLRETYRHGGLSWHIVGLAVPTST